MSPQYNPWAILVAAIAGVVLGMLWYAPPVFGRRWQGLMGIHTPSAQAMLLWAVCYLGLAFTVAYVFTHMGVSGLEPGLRWGGTLGLGVAGLGVAPNYAFGRKPLALFAIEAGYVALALCVMGGILGVWS
ncbi:MAG: DUF1761 domain-containing protein [Deltaproteobacteria bacterium]|nr:DUF1761 domain-containing protein [Deltaproteobacteria bacterium]